MDALRSLDRPALCVPSLQFLLVTPRRPLTAASLPNSFHLSTISATPGLTYVRTSGRPDFYHVTYRSDRLTTVALVYTLFVLDAVQSAAVAGEAWDLLCSGWGRPSAVDVPGWWFTAIPLVSGLSAYFLSPSCFPLPSFSSLPLFHVVTTQLPFSPHAR